MTDRISTYIISFDGDVGNLRTVLESFKSNVRSTFADIDALAKKVELFPNLEKNVQDASTALQLAKNNVVVLEAAIASLRASGAAPTKELEAGLKSATTQVNTATTAFNKSVDALSRLQTQLTRAGVDTKNLAAEQQRLALAQQQAAAAATEQAAKQALGLKTLKDITPEINRLHAAYNTLAASGTLSVKDLAAAQQQLQTKVAELRASVTSVGQAAKAGTPFLAEFFANPLTKILALVGGVTGVIAAIKSVTDAAKEFAQGVAEIGTVTNLSKDQLGELGAGARQLARDIGVDVNEALKALFELIRSGVPPENALDVLRISAEAAKASLTDIGTGVKAANLLLDAFGATVGDLPILFDKIVRGAHEGGATLKEFADSAGPLLNVARAAGVSFDDLLATLTVLVDKSGNAEKSFGDLTKIIAKLDTSDARNKLRDLGIESTSLVEIFRQIGERGLSLKDILGLDLASGGAKSAAALATLTSNASELPEKLEKITSAAGATKKSLDDLLDTPKERAARFNAAFQETQIILGQLFGAESKLAVVTTKLLNAFNDLPEAMNKNTIAGTALDNSIARSIASFFGVKPAVESSKQALREYTEAQRVLAEQAKQTAAEVARANTSLADANARLTADIQALQAAATRDITDLNARAEAQIAALDRSKAAQAATAAATLEIQLKLAADRLAIIEASEKAITDAVNAAIAAREKAARANGENEKKIAADSASARIAALGTVLTQYQAHYAALINLAQQQAGKAESFELARIDIVRKVEAEIRAIRLEGLSGLDQFVAKNAEIDRLISEGRKKAAQGDVEQAKAFFDQAIAESKGLTKVIDENGVVVITALQARTARLDALKRVADAANESIGDQGEAAKKGSEVAIAEATKVGDKIKDLQAQYDELKKVVAEGLKFKVDTDENSVNAALAVLAELTKPRTAVITIKTVNETGAPVSPDFVGPPLPAGGATGSFARGGLVQVMQPVPFASGGAVPGWTTVSRSTTTNASKDSSSMRERFMDFRTRTVRNARTANEPQKFATGGPVFRTPTWSKVPGSGNGDTVPAALQPGSFVIRKAAVHAYGDLAMAKLAQGFSIGGNVLAPPPLYAFGTAGTLQKKPPGPYASDIPAGTTTLGPEIPSAELPSDPKEKRRKILRYAADVATAAIQVDGLFYWKSWLNRLSAEQKAYETSPSDANLDAVLGTARSIGLNIGVTNKNGLGLQGFDVDGRRWHRTAGTAGFSPPGLAGIGNTFDFFAKGGRVGEPGNPAQTPSERAAFDSPAGQAIAAPPGAPERGFPLLPELRIAAGPAWQQVFERSNWRDVERGREMVRESVAEFARSATESRYVEMAAGSAASAGRASAEGGATDRITPADAGPTPASTPSTSTRDRSAILRERLLQTFGVGMLPSLRIPEVIRDAVMRASSARLAPDDPQEFSAGAPVLPPAADLQRASSRATPSVTRWAAGVPTLRETLRESLKEAERVALTSAFDTRTREGRRDTSAHLHETFRQFAAGGPSGTDTVPAMLTPGEWVIPKQATAALGSDFLHAVNAMRVPRDILRNITIAGPPVSRFATGGPVGDVSRGATFANQSTSNRTSTININANPGDILSPENIKRLIVPVLRDIERKR